MEVNRIISERLKDGNLREYTVRKQIDVHEIVSYEEFITESDTRGLYVYARGHEFVIDSSFNDFKENIRLDRVIANE